MKRIFQTNVMMTVAVLLMAVMPGQRLAAQQAGGKQGGVMQLTLEVAMDLACSQSVDAAVALNQLKSAYWQFRTYKAERLPELIFNGTLPTFNNNYNSHWRTVRDPEHSVHGRYGLAEHRPGYDAAAGC